MSDNQITAAYIIELLNEKVESITAKTESANSGKEQMDEMFISSFESNDFTSNSNTAIISNSSNPVLPKEQPMAKPISFPVGTKISESTKFDVIDKHAMFVPENFCTDIPTLVKYLTEPVSNDFEKVRAIFTWIAHNISYDDYGYNTGNYADGSAQGVFTNRVSVCNGFAELFKAMGEEAGLETVKISGYAKGYGHRLEQTFTTTNHAWNAVRINGKWILIDVTWGHGSGSTVNGRLQSQKKFDDFWFDTNPYDMIFTHLPEDSQWQLIDNRLSKTQFERLPYVQSSFFSMGFSGESILDEILSGQLISLPTIYSDSEHAQAISLPISGTLMCTQPMHIVLKSATANAMAVINNGKWTHFEKEDDTFSLTLLPQQGELKVSARFNNQGNSYSTLLAYRVK